MFNENKVVVIGGNAAGLSAAFKLKRLASQFDVTVFERLPRSSYKTCWLPYYISDEVDEYEELFIQSQKSYKKAGIKVRHNHKVVEIQPHQHKIIVEDKKNVDEKEVGYDYLIIATGASPRILPVEGANSSNIFSVRYPREIKRMKELIDSGEVSEVAVIGGGYIGLEIAEALATKNIKVRIVEKNNRLFPFYAPEMSKAIIKQAREMNIELHLDSAIHKIEQRDEKSYIHLEDERIKADIVVMSVGVEPNTKVASDANIDTSDEGAIKVDKRLKTSKPKIFAAGDCSTVENALTGKDEFIPLGTYANREGKLVAKRIANQREERAPVVGTAVTRFFDLTICKTGLTEAEADRNHFRSIAKKIEYSPSSLRFRGGENTLIKLVAEEKTHKLLGAQIIGNPLNAERINLVSSALQRGLTLSEFINLDFSYTPPYSGVWNPLTIAAKELLKETRR